jgi:hypothetical protein
LRLPHGGREAVDRGSELCLSDLRSLVGEQSGSLSTVTRMGAHAAFISAHSVSPAAFAIAYSIIPRAAQ